MARAPASAKQATKPATPRIHTLVTNREALHQYQILEPANTGPGLQGTEVKSIRAGDVNLGNAYARTENGEIWLWERAHCPLRPVAATKRGSAAAAGETKRQVERAIKEAYAR